MRVRLPPSAFLRKSIQTSLTINYTNKASGKSNKHDKLNAMRQWQTCGSVLTELDEKDVKKLYDKDFYAWVNKNLELLKAKQYDQIDWDNLTEEIEDMGKSKKMPV